MKQLVQALDSGQLRIADVPAPAVGPTEVLVRTSHSVLSSGTERAVRQLAQASLVGKARARPDLVRQVVRRARHEGLVSTARAVRARLRTDMPLGYSAAGTVLEVGEAVSGLLPGERVATAGAGHGELQLVPGLLAVPIPDGVGFDEAALATIGAIAINGLRLAEVGPGAKVCVIGLGLLGQLSVRIALAAGCEVAGIDLRPWTVERATHSGAFAMVERGDTTTEALMAWTKGRGVDAVLLTAATSSSDPVRRSPLIARDRATVVVVGDVGLSLERTPFYDKELTLRFARSYGPGRYDRAYEQYAIDYPIGHVRWTEARNLESFLALLASGRLRVRDLITHTLPFERAEEAYALITGGSEQCLGVELAYTTEPQPAVAASPRTAVGGSGAGVGLIGAGQFARTTLVPALQRAGFSRLIAVASGSGLSAATLAGQVGFEKVLPSAGSVITEPGVDVVVVATRHDTHEDLTVAALEAGKHVFCEKPLALSTDGLQRVAAAWRAGSSHLMVGFNRRYAPCVTAIRERLGRHGGPLVITYRVNAGRLPKDHWYHDRRQGGRLLGEVCHFVDTCCALAGSDVASVFCAGSGDGEALAAGDLVVTLRFADGSVATITYASGGHASTPKERLEVLGRGHSAVIDDFRTTTLDGKKLRVPPGDKGHTAELELLHRALQGEVSADDVTVAALASSAATLAAAESLLTGRAVAPLRV